MDEEKRKECLRYVSILRGIVSGFERVAITCDNESLLTSEIGYRYCDAVDFIRMSRDSFYAEVKKAITLWENYLDGVNEWPFDREDYFQFVFHCLINYHKMLIYGAKCKQVCFQTEGAELHACESCEKNARPKEEIENDIYLEALQETLRLFFAVKSGDNF